MSIDASDLSIN